MQWNSFQGDTERWVFLSAPSILSLEGITVENACCPFKNCYFVLFYIVLWDSWMMSSTFRARWFEAPSLSSHKKVVALDVCTSSFQGEAGNLVLLSEQVRGRSVCRGEVSPGTDRLLGGCQPVLRCSSHWNSMQSGSFHNCPPMTQSCYYQRPPGRSWLNYFYWKMQELYRTRSLYSNCVLTKLSAQLREDLSR